MISRKTTVINFMLQFSMRLNACCFVFNHWQFVVLILWCFSSFKQTNHFSQSVFMCWIDFSSTCSILKIICYTLICFRIEETIPRIDCSDKLSFYSLQNLGLRFLANTVFICTCTPEMSIITTVREWENWILESENAKLNLCGINLHGNWAFMQSAAVHKS